MSVTKTILPITDDFRSSLYLVMSQNFYYNNSPFCFYLIMDTFSYLNVHVYVVNDFVFKDISKDVNRLATSATENEVTDIQGHIYILLFRYAPIYIIII